MIGKNQKFVSCHSPLRLYDLIMATKRPVVSLTAGAEATRALLMRWEQQAPLDDSQLQILAQVAHLSSERPFPRVRIIPRRALLPFDSPIRCQISSSKDRKRTFHFVGENFSFSGLQWRRNHSLTMRILWITASYS